MKFSCSQQDLASAVGIAVRAVTPRVVVPVLGNILLKVDGEELRLSGQNMEIGISCWIAAKVEQPGAITVPARLFADIIAKLLPEPVTVELNERTQTVWVRQAGTEVKVMGLPAQDFPVSPPFTGGTDEVIDAPPADGAELDAQQLRQTLEQVAFVASRDESRMNTRCVKLEIQPGCLTAAATDGFRLGVRRLTLDKPLSGLQPATLLIPAKSVAELVRVLGDDAKAVTMALCENRVIFQVGEGSGRVLLVAMLTDAKYPDYQAIIPKSIDTTIVVDKAPLVRLVQMARLFADEKKQVQLVCGEGSIRVVSHKSQVGDSAGGIEAQHTGKPLEIVLAVDYLMEALGHIDAPQVTIEANGAKRPLCLRPAGVSRDEFLHLIMPIGPSK